MLAIPPWEQCRKLPTGRSFGAAGEHVVKTQEVRFDGRTHVGWCYFCGEAVYAESGDDYWHPYRTYIISEAVEYADYTCS